MYKYLATGLLLFNGLLVGTMVATVQQERPIGPWAVLDSIELNQEVN